RTSRADGDGHPPTTLPRLRRSRSEVSEQDPAPRHAVPRGRRAALRSRRGLLAVVVVMVVAVAGVAAVSLLSGSGDETATGGAGPTTPAPTTTSTEAPTTTPTAPTTTTTAPTTPPAPPTAATEPTRTPAPPTTTTPAPPDPADDGTLELGESGDSVLALQERLVELGYWLGEPDGTYGQLARQAVMAFQKVEGLGRDGVA